MVNPNRTTSPLQQQSQPLIATGLPSHQQKVAQQLLFADNFWGEKINGFDLLCANLKHSLTSVKELEQFLRDCASSEDSYAKVLNKLVATSNKFSTNGTFAPLWSCLRELNEKFASAHLQLVHQLQELIKDIQKYIDELSKKIKKIRENEVQTQTVVGQFQEIQMQLQKSKEAYHNLCIEFDKARRQLDPTQLASYQQLSQQQVSTSNLMSLVNNTASTSNAGSGVTTNQPGLTSANSASALGLATNTNANNGQNMINTTLAGGLELASTAPVPLPQQQQSGGATDRLTSLATSITANRVTQLLKIEKKVKLALEDYKSSIEKYNQIRVEYERKLADSCNHFQYAEETHLKQMRTFIDVYAKLVAAIQLNKQQIYTDFSARLNDQYTVDYLMQTFIENKRTGQERPDVAQFIEVACNPFNNPPITNSTAATQLLDGNDYSLFLNNTTTNTAAGRVTNSPLSFNQQITNRTNDQLDSNASLRSTPPVYFSTSNLTNNSQMYSQLTNSVSTTTLNAINQQQQHQIQNSNSTSISPFNGPTSTTNEKPAKNDSSTKGGGLNIFNVDFLSRKNRERKEKKNAAAAAAAASTNEKSSKFSRGKKSKQNTNNSNQYENLGASNALNTTLNQTNGNLSVSNHSNKDSSSINSEDSTEQQKINDSNGLHQQQIGSPISHLKATNKLSSPNLLDAPTQQTLTSSANQGSNTARSISSIGTSSLSFDLLDQLKISSSPNNAIAGQTATSVNNGGGQTAGGSDVDSEGYSIRPADACSLDLRSQNFNANSLSSGGGRHNRNKDNDDMNNFYNSSSTSNSDDSDSDAGDSIGPVKVMLKIKPKSEVAEDAEKQKNNTEVLKEISKCLQLKPSGSQLSNASNTNTLGRNAKSRAYYYNYGTSAVSASNSNSSSTTPTPTSENPIPIHTSSHITRSVSVGNVVATNTQSLLDLDFSKAAMSQSHMPINKIMEQSTTSSTAAANNLYNIDEDKEVESSFNPTYPNQTRKSSTVTGTQSPANNNNNSNSSSSTAANGRFTPACFPGRTTPDFRHTTSLFEQQGTRASIVSPLTINGGSDIIPIAIAFNETIHAYFKMGDSSKFKVKCFGCMKISFPFAILKLLAIELPQLEFRLTQLQIANQDLKINNQLLQRRTVNIDSVQSSSEEDLTFEFIGSQLTHELKQQHQQNKQAAFFNFELLKYEFKYVSQPPPLVLNASWACIQPEEHTFELCLDYVFQFRKNLSQVNFMVILPLTVVWGDQVCKVNLLKSEPNAATQENENKLQILWQVTSINSSSRITAKFNLSAPGHAKPSYIPSSNNVYEQFYQPVYVKFHIDNETLSQVKLQILSPNYKLSLLREKIETGKYFCNYDQQSQQASTQNQTQPTEPQKPIQSSSSELQSNTQSNEESSASPPPLPPLLPIPSNNQISNKKTPAAGSLSTHIGSTVDVLLNY